MAERASNVNSWAASPRRFCVRPPAPYSLSRCHVPPYVGIKRTMPIWPRAKPMDQLWAPWRSAYVGKEAPPKGEGDECFLCRGLSESNDRANLILQRTSLSTVVLNRYPYNNGHLLVAPRAH